MRSKFFTIGLTIIMDRDIPRHFLIIINEMVNLIMSIKQ